MARRKYRRHPKGLLASLDWSIRPESTREIVAVILLILGALFLLSIFGLAGSFGQFLSRSLFTLWGVLGYLVSLIFLFLGGVLFFSQKIFKPAQVIGIILCFLFLPGLFSNYGGAIGNAVFSVFSSILGNYATWLILFGIGLVSLLIATNTSLKSLFSKLRFLPQAKVPEKVTVFRQVGEKTIPLGRPTPPYSPISKTGWEFPPIDLLQYSTTRASSGNISRNVEIIQKTLKDFGISVSMSDVNIGPAVTQYTLKPAEGVKLSNITARVNDLALSLASHPIRIEAPIPGKALVGIEVPNKIPAIVTLREILESEEFKKSPSNLSLTLGRDVAGMPQITDLERMPHLLIAGSTGSGKSICLNGIILALIYQNSPASLRFLLVDPKRVEFTHYNGIPYLLTPVITDLDKTVSALRWAIAEMERRFHLFQQTHRRDIASYNQNPPAELLPYIIIIIDELADLMAQAANEVEAAIVRLAQMARATGIHLVVATQRPSVDVITGLIKANITSRIAFAVASQVDSRTILDQAGAERLLGSGDMLFQSSEMGKPKRIQGVMVFEKEVRAVTDFLKREGEVSYDSAITEFTPPPRIQLEKIDDELYQLAKEVVISAGKASASLLQRRLRIGYARAARLLDQMESEGIIGQAEGAKPRDVLISPSEYDSLKKQVGKNE